MNRLFLETPIGKIRFEKNKEKLFNEISDIDLIERYLKIKKETGFIEPESFQVMKERKLIYAGEFEQDLLNRLRKLKNGGRKNDR